MEPSKQSFEDNRKTTVEQVMCSDTEYDGERPRKHIHAKALIEEDDYPPAEEVIESLKYLEDQRVKRNSVDHDNAY